MAQVTVYFPSELEEQLRQRARQEGMSLSAYVSLLARRGLRPPSWPDDFDSLFGSWEGDLEPPEDPPPEPVTL